MSRPRLGKVGSPGSLRPISGQGLGFAAQNEANSSAQSAGRITRLACRWPGARPVVTVVWRPARICSRKSLAGLLADRVVGAPLAWSRFCFDRIIVLQGSRHRAEANSD